MLLEVLDCDLGIYCLETVAVENVQKVRSRKHGVNVLSLTLEVDRYDWKHEEESRL